MRKLGYLAAAVVAGAAALTVAHAGTASAATALAVPPDAPATAKATIESKSGSKVTGRAGYVSCAIAAAPIRAAKSKLAQTRPRQQYRKFPVSRGETAMGDDSMAPPRLQPGCHPPRTWFSLDSALPEAPDERFSRTR